MTLTGPLAGMFLRMREESPESYRELAIILGIEEKEAPDVSTTS